MSISTAPLRVTKLIMVSSQNNNKYYEMREQEGGTFSVSYGRVGSRGAIRQYPIRQWEKKYREKVRKGYRDVTHLFAEKDESKALLDIKNPAVKRLINTLTLYADKAINTNYTVTADQVTHQQVNEAQAVLDELVGMVHVGMAPEGFNTRLLELYTIIPRKMGNVREHLVEGALDAPAMAKLRDQLGVEQDTLDVMAGQVKVNTQTREAAEEATPQTLLDALGLHVEPVDDAAGEEAIRRLMGKQADCFRRAFKVTNLRTQAAFDAHVASSSNKKVTQLWHGSRNENWLSIMENGLVLRPAHAVITGKMFGYGLYFADKCRKSLNYTSLRGSYWVGGTDTRAYLALYDVHVGHQLKLLRHASWCYELNEQRLQERKKRFGKPYHSLFARGGVDLLNNEYIIYNQSQCTVRYLVEVGQ